MMTTVPELEELMVQSDSEDPRCEMTYVCEEHGEEACGGRARWVMIIDCPEPPTVGARVLVCDACHDIIVEEAESTAADGHVVRWLPL